MVMRGSLFGDLFKRQLENLYILTRQRVLLTCAHDERVINKRKGVLVARYMLHVTSEVEIFNVICQQKD